LRRAAPRAEAEHNVLRGASFARKVSHLSSNGTVAVRLAFGDSARSELFFCLSLAQATRAASFSRLEHILAANGALGPGRPVAPARTAEVYANFGPARTGALSALVAFEGHSVGHAIASV